MSESSESRAVILSALLKETLHRCIVCGSPIGEGEPCSIATIYPPSPSGETDHKCIYCGCQLKKMTYTVSIHRRKL